MLLNNNNTKALLELVRAGLFPIHDEGIRVNGLSLNKPSVDWDEVYRLAEEQSFIGLVAAGIDGLKDLREDGLNIPQEVKLQFIGLALQIEQRNVLMNAFVAELIEKLRRANVYGLLLKGQGVAQCYEKPLWRSCGDVDLLFSAENYEKAKAFLTPLAEHVDTEDTKKKHLGMTIDQWTVELHGTMHTGISRKVDKGIDEVQDDCFCKGNVRSWDMNGTVVYLPSPDNDVILVFTHFLHHFFIEGVGLRQVCDWCRLLWTYKDSLNYGLLESRIKRMGLMSEWKAFAALAVEYLGMPIDAVPLLDGRSLMEDGRWRKKGERILKHILKGEPYSKIRDTWAIAKIFPLNTCKFLPAIFLNVNGLKIKERFFVPQKSQKGRK